MARTKRSSKLDTRNARKKCEREKYYMEPLSKGLYLRYRIPKNGAAGTWSVCIYDPKTKNQKKITIGVADDFADADGTTFLDYATAQERANETFQREIRQAAIKESGGQVIDVDSFTVADAVQDYFGNKEATGKRAKGIKIYRQVADAWIVPELGEIPLVGLTVKRLEAWRDWMAKQPRRGYGQTNQPPKSADETRARQSTCNRVIGILQAALNFAVKRNMLLAREAMPYQWMFLDRFANTEKARTGKLSNEDRKKLLANCKPDFKLLVQGALLTACRHGEIRQVCCKDYKHTGNGNGYLIIPATISKSGKARAIQLTEAGTNFFDKQTLGKEPEDLIFTRGNGFPWLEGSQKKTIQRACIDAGIPVICFHELRHVRMSALANAGLEPELNALQAGHASTEIGEKFYIHRDSERIAARIEATGGKDDWDIVGGSKIQQMKTRRPNL